MRTSKSLASAAIAALLLLLPGTTLAQTLSLPFQGYLDLDGEPCDGIYFLRFRLETETSVLRQELPKEVQISAGHFVTVLDFLATHFRPDNKLYLRVRVCEDDSSYNCTDLQNRQRLMPSMAAYAAPTGFRFQVGALEAQETSIEIRSPLSSNTGTINATGNVSVTGNVSATGTVSAQSFQPQYVSEWRVYNVNATFQQLSFDHGLGQPPSFYVVQGCRDEDFQVGVGCTGQAGGVWQFTESQAGSNMNPYLLRSTYQQVIVLCMQEVVMPGVGTSGRLRVLAWR
jgi:hypothetical protein